MDARNHRGRHRSHLVLQNADRDSAVTVTVRRAGFSGGVSATTATVSAPPTITGNPDDAIPAEGDTLEARLAWIRDNAESHNWYLVEVGIDEDIEPQDLAFEAGGMVVGIILRGSGTVGLSSPGSIFTVGSGVTLTLDGITLEGMDENTASLVTVEPGGNLFYGGRHGDYR